MTGKIKMLTTSAGPEGVLMSGRTYTVPSEVSEKKAVDLISANCAVFTETPVKTAPEQVEREEKVEKTEAPSAPEQAVSHTNRGRKGR